MVFVCPTRKCYKLQLFFCARLGNDTNYNGLFVPDLRSSELWADTEYSKLVTENYQPLDILFFHKKNDAYGAHVAVFLGDGKAIHNAKKIGLPVIWDIETFFQYTVLSSSVNKYYYTAYLYEAASCTACAM